MSDLQRYDPISDSGSGYGTMRRCTDGDYVRYEDLDDIHTLRAEVERLTKERDEHMAAAAREQTFRMKAEQVRDEAVNANLNNVANYAFQVQKLRELLVRCREGLWQAGFSDSCALVRDLDRALVEGGGR